MKINRIFDFAYQDAMRDATLEKAYTGDKTDALKNHPKAKRAVKDYIDFLLAKEQSKKDVKEKFEKAVKAVINDFDDGSEETFTFGNAQKLINMTAKYIFIGCYAYPQLTKHFQYCDCPMDNIMAKLVADAAEKDPELKSKIFRKKSTLQGWSSKKLKEGTGKDEYDLYQDLVRALAEKEDLSPLEYDYEHWA